MVVKMFKCRLAALIASDSHIIRKIRPQPINPAKGGYHERPICFYSCFDSTCFGFHFSEHRDGQSFFFVLGDVLAEGLDDIYHLGHRGCCRLFVKQGKTDFLKEIGIRSQAAKGGRKWLKKKSSSKEVEDPL